MWFFCRLNRAFFMLSDVNTFYTKLICNKSVLFFSNGSLDSDVNIYSKYNHTVKIIKIMVIIPRIP